ncbi:MAG: 3'-5' exonuclease domain-containing protein 2 [Bacteroidales bacterium]|nr:3'-5' exonuclease domain-containing protein 2 [Bacteroidales bacterium]
MIEAGFAENITNEEIDELELSWYKGEIVLVDTLEKFYEIFPNLLKEKVLGFDTETKPSFTKGIKHKIALIQLSTADITYLIRVNKIGISDELISLFTDESILKVGVAIHDDLRFLRKKKNAEAKGLVDLQRMVTNFGIQCAGLKKLTAIILGFRISKRQQVSDWEAPVLSDAQIIYAATDSWVCREIYFKLKNIEDNYTNTL